MEKKHPIKKLGHRGARLENPRLTTPTLTINIRNEAQRMIAAEIVATASRGMVSQGKWRKSSVLARVVEAGSSAL